MVVPDGVTSVGTAFAWRTQITAVTLPDAVTSLSGAFEGCSSLERVNIPLSVRTIYTDSFADCPALKEFIVPAEHAVFAAYDGVLYGKTSSGLSVLWAPPAVEGQIAVPDGVTVIPEEAFVSCVNMTGVYLPDSVLEIGRNAFAGCVSLSDIRLPANLSYLGRHAFPYNNDLNCNEYENGLYIGNEEQPYQLLVKIKDATAAAYTIHPATRMIADNVFAINGNVEEIVIPDSVFYIGNSAFYGCENLKRIVLPASLQIVESYGLQCNLEEIYYRGTAQQWAALDKQNIDEDLPVYYYSASQPSGEGNYWHYDADGKIQVWE